MEPWQIAIQAAAVLLSPLVAIVVGRRLDDRKARRTRKENLFTILVGSRHDPNQQFMSSLNLIPVLYDKGSRVRQLHEESDIRNVFQLKPTGVQWTHGDLGEVPKP